MLLQSDQLPQRITDGLEPFTQGADRPPIGCEVGIVEFVPRDRHRYRCTCGGPCAEGTYERLVDGVLRVVEPGPTTTFTAAPLPADQIGDHLSDRTRDPLDPITGLLEAVVRGH